VSISFRRAKSTDKVVDLKTFNDMQIALERVANMTTDQYFNLTKGDPNYMLYSRTGASSTMSYSDWAFGFSISGAVVTVNAGYVFHGMRAAITVTGTDVTIVADNTYIIVNTASGGGGIIISSLVFPQNTAEQLYFLLYKVTLTNGIASVEPGNIHHLGSIFVPGVFG
jgi:hypothetical protein